MPNEFGCLDPPPGNNETLQCRREAVTLHCLSLLCPFRGSSGVDHNTNNSKNAQRLLLGDCTAASPWSLFSVCASEISFLMASCWVSNVRLLGCPVPGFTINLHAVPCCWVNSYGGNGSTVIEFQLLNFSGKHHWYVAGFAYSSYTSSVSVREAFLWDLCVTCSLPVEFFSFGALRDHLHLLCWWHILAAAVGVHRSWPRSTWVKGDSLVPNLCADGFAIWWTSSQSLLISIAISDLELCVFSFLFLL